MRIGHVHIGLLIAVAALLGGCGPSERDVGQAMMLWAIPLAAITMGLERLYVRIAYRRMKTKPGTTAEFNGCVLAGLVVLWVLSLVRGATGGEHYGIIGIIMAVGYCGYIGFALVTAHLSRAPWASRVAIAMPVVLVVLPALAFAWFGATDPADDTNLVWLIEPLVWCAVNFSGLIILGLAFLYAWVHPHRPPPPVAPARTVRR